MANLLLLLLIVLPHLQSKPSRYKMLSCYCWWRNFHSGQLICCKYPKCFLFGFLQHFPDLNWRTPETIHVHQLYPPSNISAVFWRWFFLFPPLVDTNKYLYLEPQWPPFLKDNPSFKQGPNSNQNKGHQRVPGLYHSQWAFRFAPVGLTGSAVKVNKVTLIPRGQAKGLTWFTPGEDQSLISAAMLKAPVTLQKVSPKESGDSGRMSTLEICTRILKTMAWKGQLLFPLWQVFSNFTGSQVEFQVSHNEKRFFFQKTAGTNISKSCPWRFKDWSLGYVPSAFNPYISEVT